MTLSRVNFLISTRCYYDYFLIGSLISQILIISIINVIDFAFNYKPLLLKKQLLPTTTLKKECFRKMSSYPTYTAFGR